MPSSRICGLSVRSNRPIPGVDSSDAATPADLEVALGVAPPNSRERSDDTLCYVSGHLDSAGRAALMIWRDERDGRYEMRYADGTEFVLSRSGKAIWANWPDHCTIEDTATYLLGPVIGFALLLRGTHALHASAIAVDGRAIALAGGHEAGKSTTAAAFANRGHRVMADDVVALKVDGARILAQPAYPALRLWPESVEALFGAREALPRLTPTWDKRHLDLARSRDAYENKALPLAAVYILDERSDDAAAPLIEAMSANASFIGLVAHSYAPGLKDRRARAAEFDLLRRVVAAVPVRRVTPHSDIGRIDALCAAIVDDCRASGIAVERSDESRSAHV